MPHRLGFCGATITEYRTVVFQLMAERVGFEPTVLCSTPDFESGTFDHSATSPNRTAIIATNRSIHATCAIHPNGTLLAKPDKAPSENVLEAENFDDLIKAA